MGKIASVLLLVFLSSQVLAKPNKKKQLKYFVQVHSAKVKKKSSVVQWQTAVGRAHLSRALNKNPEVTTSNKVAKKHRLKKYRADFSVVEMTKKSVGNSNTIKCSYTVAVSNSEGKILSDLDGNAAVRIRRRDVMPHHVPEV